MHAQLSLSSGENFTKNLEIVKEFQALARKKGCTPSQLALAWVIAQGCIPIPGTSKIARIEENFAARDVDLTDTDLAELRQVINAAKPVGERCVYPAQDEFYVDSSVQLCARATGDDWSLNG